jgi:hypothetical protein
MNAWLWKCDPMLWNDSQNLSRYEVVEKYLEHKSKRVYWATPEFKDKVKVGDRAFIWRTGAGGGIVAVGTVAEKPQEYTGRNGSQFEVEEQLEPPGWDEKKAKSKWKTGINIEATFWHKPIHVSQLVISGTIQHLSKDQRRQIEGLLAKCDRAQREFVTRIDPKRVLDGRA